MAAEGVGKERRVMKRTRRKDSVGSDVLRDEVGLCDDEALDEDAEKISLGHEATIVVAVVARGARKARGKLRLLFLVSDLELEQHHGRRFLQRYNYYSVYLSTLRWILR